MPRRLRPWLAVLLAALVSIPVLLALGVAAFGWNWARGPLQDLARRQTGRELRIGGDLGVQLAWPAPRVRAQSVGFANPPWATAPQMLLADAVEVTLDLPALLHGRLEFPEVRLSKPRVFLEQASGGRKTWLLDRAQTDENRRIPIGRVLLDEGAVTYIDAAQRTAVHLALSTTDEPAPAVGAGAAGAEARSLVFVAAGRFRGEPLVAQGTGGAVLRWRDESLPSPVKLEATIGRTRVQAEGSVTGVRQLKALDLQLALQGDSLAALAPLIDIALPATPAYRASGRLRHGGTQWRYESFVGQVGQSDIAGTLQLSTAQARPVLRGAVTSRRLDLADLGPAVGARGPAPGASTPAEARVLPDLPLDTRLWALLDADLMLQAQTLRRPRGLPLDSLLLHLRLEDRRLTLDPVRFELAGGRLEAQVTLDARVEPMRGRAKAQLRGLSLARLLPTADQGGAGIGRLDGEAELSGQGASVGRLLATADGRLSLVAQDGEISRLLMEKTGLHLLEILRLNLSGDQRVHLNCAVADFGVSRGMMHSRALVLDTGVNTVTGSGSIDLGREALDLSFTPRTKVSSLVALRSPFYLRGSFSQPLLQADTGRIAARGAEALALGLLNPLLALIPLFEAGPGADNPCAALVGAARTSRGRAPA